MVCMVPFQSETSKYPASTGHFFAQNRAIRKDFIASEPRGCVLPPLFPARSAFHPSGGLEPICVQRLVEARQRAIRHYLCTN